MKDVVMLCHIIRKVQVHGDHPTEEHLISSGEEQSPISTPDQPRVFILERRHHTLQTERYQAQPRAGGLLKTKRQSRAALFDRTVSGGGNVL